MRTVVATALLLACSQEPHVSPRNPIPLSEVVKLPAPGTVAPTHVAFSPDDAMVTWLHAEEGSLTRELWGVPVTGGEPRRILSAPGGGEQEGELSLEEQLRRERLRERATGVTRYQWVKRGPRLVVPIGGDVYTQDGVDGTLVPLVEGSVDEPLGFLDVGGDQPRCPHRFG